MRNILRGMTRAGKLKVMICGILLLIMAAQVVSFGCTNSSTTAEVSSLPPSSFSEIVEEVMPSVVYIFVETDQVAGGQTVTGSGSGIILSPDGYILTNRHVIQDARRIEVTLQDRRVFEATEYWMDNIIDLAVVKIEAEDLPYSEFGNPGDIRVGDWVVALGHPLGLSPEEGGATVTVGIVSNLGRSFFISGVPYYDVIQTDAAINPGNSGGPLVNMDGEVIGINSAGAGDAQNINYAINIETGRRVYEDLVEHGRVLRPYLGVNLDDVTPSIACQFDITCKLGAVIVEILPDSPADLAGLERNDVIVQFGDEEIKSAAQLIKEIWKLRAGDSVRVRYWRGNSEGDTIVELADSSQ